MNMRSICIGLAFLSLTGMAAADMISLESMQASSTEGLGTYTGTLNYTPSAHTTDLGTLLISLTNTTPTSTGGFITGLAFNVHSSDPAAAVSLIDETNPFMDIERVKAPPFGLFDHGAALGGSWAGGGSPLLGIAAGTSGTFTFQVVATDAQSLTASDFVGSSDNLADGFDFVVRFRGMAQGGSDKVPGRAAPSPGTVALMCLGAAAMTAFRKR
jgi:hypothetical protein